MGARATSADRTRPYQRSPRSVRLRAGSGFYLDLLTAELDGIRPARRVGDGASPLVDVPAYYERERHEVSGRAGLRVTYWMLYGEERLRSRQAFIEHEGDWERVSVLLERGSKPNAYLPVALRFYRRRGVEDVAWDDLELASSGDASRAHPVLFAALGSHAPYPTAGERRPSLRLEGATVTTIDETTACEACPEWRTWLSLRPLRSEPWYGFGGGWGLAWQTDERSGPLGPWPHRR